MNPVLKPVLDPRDEIELVSEFRSRRAGYLPQWNPPPGTSGAAVEQIFAHLMETILRRLNQAPDKNRLAFFSFLGMDAVPAQEARAPMVFQPSSQATDLNVPPGTQVAAPPPAGSNAPIVFETEHGLNVSAAKLTAVATLWPGRDEYVDHSQDFAAGQPFVLFDHAKRKSTPHVLYLAHSTLLAMTGAATVLVEFHLSQGADNSLLVSWEYWDGQIWRDFKSLQPTCLDIASTANDGTAGLTKSGSITLVSESAKTAQLAVNGYSSFWIRAILDQSLPIDPTRILPVVESLLVRTTIHQDFSLSLDTVTVTAMPAPNGAIPIWAFVRERRGSLLVADSVTLTATDPTTTVQVVTFTPADFSGVLKAATPPTPGADYEVQFSFLGISQISLPSPKTITWPTGTQNAELDLSVSLQGIALDKAFSGQLALDVTKTFFPFSAQPQPGSEFYFTQQDVLSKPGATVEVLVQHADSPQNSFSFTGQQAVPHNVIWEYWNGTEWFALDITVADAPNVSNASGSPADLDAPGIVSFTVPDDLEATTVGGQQGLWIRIRLVSGGFGFFGQLTIPPGSGNTFNYSIPVPPALSDFRLAFSWQHGPEPFEKVFTYNDFLYEDHTDDARWPGHTFPPFVTVSDLTPTLYLGTDKPLPSADAGIYFDIVEQSGLNSPGELVWEEWDGGGWRALSVEDDTEKLHLPGIVMLQPLPASEALLHFGKSLYWVRARLKDDQPPDEITVNSITLNAVWARQQRTFQNLALGVSTGAPSQVFTITQVPILDQERIEVREYSGKRAEVEWRILALQLFGNDPTVVEELELKIAAEGPATDIQNGDLRLVRDRNKRITEVWVRWNPVPAFFSSSAQDRHYLLDHFRGRLLFGDGHRGMIPPLGAAILARTFRSGGGSAGNLPVGTIKQLLGAVSGVQSVNNVRSAEGGADGESLSSFADRAPERLRSRDRAITAGDYEALAREASASVAFVRAIPGLSASGQILPGWVTVLILPESLEPQPEPSFGLREEVRAYLEAHAPLEIASAHQIVVTRPQFFPLDVSATLEPASGEDPGGVSANAKVALQSFLHPLTGGPEGHGWDLGRNVYLSDVAAVLAVTDGVDSILNVTLLVNGTPQGESVTVGSQQLVVAGNLDLTMVED